MGKGFEGWLCGLRWWCYGGVVAAWLLSSSSTMELHIRSAT